VLIAFYVVDAQTLLASLRTTIAQRAIRPTQNHAHTLKGASRASGALALGELAAELEECAGATDFVSAQDALERAEAALVRTTTTLTRRRLRTAA
jgi:HPt (histidine-containing phosphotransfer) domain-containing protein